MKIRILCLALIMLMFSSICYANHTITVVTGFGYFTDSKGNITSKATLPPGNHSLQDEYTYTEVNSKEELDNVKIYIVPKTNAELDKELKEKYIQNEIRDIAISELKKKGILDTNGDIKK